MHRLIIFASGKGSNAQNIIDYFRDQKDVSVVKIISNKKDAGVLDIAAKENIPASVINREEFNSSTFTDELKNANPSLIILAGFLWKIPEQLVAAFPGKIINIHPALLPKYGGKGMYGQFVHEAVVAAKDKESGITIHYVNNNYDEGAVILQARCPVSEKDDHASLAENIHKLEHYYFPRAIEFLLGTMTS